ncbi:MAG: tRNA pseudouridine(55) synthase TruB [Pyrinomonadaceae bacterium]
MNGILIIDKPVGLTSHDVVARLRRILKTKSIGHTGTLDPFATGVLIMLIGKATRLAQFLDKDTKEYEAVVRFGFETDTGDGTGELRITNYELRDFSADELEKVLTSFRGEIEQTPPMYSAKKVAGKKLYELARKGVEIERKPVKVTIYELRITNYELRNKTENFGLWTLDFGLKVSCSAGTYIRTLAEDIGRKLEVGAHLAELRRTGAGKFGIDKAVTLEELEEIVSKNKLGEILISMNEAVSHLPEVKLSSEEIIKTKNGIKLKIETNFDSDFCRMTDADENLIAVGFCNAAEKTVRPKLVLV